MHAKFGPRNGARINRGYAPQLRTELMQPDFWMHFFGAHLDLREDCAILLEST
jgi:hypothetical protein